MMKEIFFPANIFLKLFILWTIPSYSFAFDYMSPMSPDTICLFLGNTQVNILIYQKGEDSNLVFFNMHDDENTAVAASLAFIEKYGGKFLTLSHRGERLITFEWQGKAYKIDPNRIFTDLGIKNTLLKHSHYNDEALAEVQSFKNELIDRLLEGNKTIVIAMHNNRNSPSFSALSYAAEGNLNDEAADVYINPDQGSGDFFYTIDMQHFEYFKSKKLNVVLQDNLKATDDGSLSIYCELKGIQYINIEAERGHLDEQIRMLEALLELFPYYFKKK